MAPQTRVSDRHPSQSDPVWIICLEYGSVLAFRQASESLVHFLDATETTDARSGDPKFYESRPQD